MERTCHVRAAEASQDSKPQYGLLIECDGVLCDTHREGHRVAFNRAFSVSTSASYAHVTLVPMSCSYVGMPHGTTT